MEEKNNQVVRLTDRMKWRHSLFFFVNAEVRCNET